jgi:pseudouridine kinase
MVVIGAVAVDVKAQSFDTLVRDADVPGRVRVTLGGVARNIAKNLARVGADVSIVSAVGDDEFGRMIRDDLARAGTNIDRLMTLRGCCTATWVGVLNARGDLDVGVFGSAILARLTPQIVEAHTQTLADADLIALDATLARATIDAVVRIARTHRVPLYLNPASVARAQSVADGVGAFTLITANALEAGVLTGRRIASIDDAARAAQMLIERGVQRAIVTLGADGIVYADARETRYAPAHATRVVDTTGAGDALAAVFLLCHLQQRALDETLERALHAAALTVASEESVSEEVGKL